MNAYRMIGPNLAAGATGELAQRRKASCETCGTPTGTGFDCGICGTCAEDWNDRNVAAGRARINRRRKVNGLPPLDEEPRRREAREQTEAIERCGAASRRAERRYGTGGAR